MATHAGAPVNKRLRLSWPLNPSRWCTPAVACVVSMSTLKALLSYRAIAIKRTAEALPPKTRDQGIALPLTGLQLAADQLLVGGGSVGADCGSPAPRTPPLGVRGVSIARDGNPMRDPHSDQGAP
eukprot:6202279-Pleurochrysis_carterae.AAC.3